MGFFQARLQDRHQGAMRAALIVGLMHLLAFAVLGLVLITVTRGRLGFGARS